MRSSENSFVVGYVIALTAGVGLVGFVSTGSFDAFSDWLCRWQALAAGMIALAGAVLGAWFLWKQIKDQREERRQELKRLQTKARLQMPNALSKINLYLAMCLKAWQNQRPEERGQVPRDALQILIEYSSLTEGGTFEVFRKLIEHSQVFEARLSGSKQGRPRNFSERFLEDISEYAYFVDQLWEFARFEVNEVVPREQREEDYIKWTRELPRVFKMDLSVRLQQQIEDALRSQFSFSRD